jgi:hypothetical protein
MYWTRENVVHMRFVRLSTIWEGCIKCYLPALPIYYLCTGVVLLLLSCIARPGEAKSNHRSHSQA